MGRFWTFESQLRLNMFTASLVSEIAKADQFLAGLGDSSTLPVDGMDQMGGRAERQNRAAESQGS